MITTRMAIIFTIVLIGAVVISAAAVVPGAYSAEKRSGQPGTGPKVIELGKSLREVIKPNPSWHFKRPL